MAIVAVAMSGGVDSSVAAYLLQEAGHQVIGLTMQLWSEQGKEKEKPGFWKAVEDARQVADRLGFPHYTLNLQESFEQEVVQYFITEYLQGRTPNPCVVCNRRIKFGLLIEHARSLGAEFIATGHYARVEQDKETGRYVLLRGIDLRKDQSYFLYGLSQEQLRYIIFPLGLYLKTNIRQLAERLKLNVADKPESQEVCFIENNNYREFLKQRVASQIRPGPFLDQQGRWLGQHQGLPFYTVGQRKGLGLALGRPMYVVQLIPEENAVVLGEDKELYSRRVWAADNNYIPFAELNAALKVEAKIRYAAAPATAVIQPAAGNQVLIEFDLPQRAVTPGQAVVYYQDNLVVGGGTIVRAEE